MFHDRDESETIQFFIVIHVVDLKQYLKKTI